MSMLKSWLVMVGHNCKRCCDQKSNKKSASAECAATACATMGGNLGDLCGVADWFQDGDLKSGESLKIQPNGGKICQKVAYNGLFFTYENVSTLPCWKFHGEPMVIRTHGDPPMAGWPPRLLRCEPCQVAVFNEATGFRAVVILRIPLR